MDQQDQSHTTTEDDLTATVPEGGPNAPHPNDEGESAPEATTESAVDAAQEETEEWVGHDGLSAENGATADPMPEPSEPSEWSGPHPEPQPTSTEVHSTPPVAATPTAAADNGGPSEPEASKSGDQQRPYVILEEMDVIPVHLLTEKLTEAQAKKLAGTTPVRGYVVAHEGIVGRSGEHAMEQSYEKEQPPEYVTALLPLSVRNFRPVEAEPEVQTKTKLTFKRR